MRNHFSEYFFFFYYCIAYIDTIIDITLDLSKWQTVYFIFEIYPRLVSFPFKVLLHLLHKFLFYFLNPYIYHIFTISAA